MQVKAIKPAFIAGNRIRVGQVLSVPNDTKGSWFEKVKAEKPAADKKGSKKKAEPDLT